MGDPTLSRSGRPARRAASRSNSGPPPAGAGGGGGGVRKVLELAGIEDIWTRSSGNTRTTVNFAKATFNALQNTAEARVPQETWEKREVIE